VFEGFNKQHIQLDGHDYELQVRINDCSPEIPVLVMVSCIKNLESLKLVKAAVRSIRKFTMIGYKLWVVDNNSPVEHLEWLSGQDDINLVFIRNEPAQKNGSYANALGLETVAKIISPETKYFMTLHQDVMPTKKGWLTYLLSKFSDEIRAVGLREDHGRVPEGVIHVLGYIIDWQIFQRLRLSFWPELPIYDVGDKAIYLLKQAGYKYFATHNTIWNNKLHEILRPPYKGLSFDMSLDDKNDVIFMHLGRGVRKSQNSSTGRHKSIAGWIDFAQKELDIYWERQSLSKRILKELQLNPCYSLRRCFVDDFFFRAIRHVPAEADVLDIGGKRVSKRGLFNVEVYGHKVKYVNIDSLTKPDYLSDANNIDVSDNSFDCVILAEILEHVPNPMGVLQEAYRLLKPGGYALLSAPFNFHVHADPNDYGRYTDGWYKRTLFDVGFRNIEIEKQGLFFATYLNMSRFWIAELNKSSKLRNKITGKLVLKFFPYLARKSLRWDSYDIVKNSDILSGYTTGYGVVCEKPIS